MDFDKDSLNMISVGDLSTGDLAKVQVEKSTFRLKKNKIFFAGGQFKILYSTDSLIVQQGNKSNSRLVFKRLSPKLKTKDITSNCFKGSYVIKRDKYLDSLCFLSDSVLIHTGDNDMNFPTKRWNLIAYKGFQFLNIQDILTPLTVIKSCTTDKVTLVYSYQKVLEFEMNKTRTLITKEKLIGRWTEIHSNLKPPTPPHLEEKDQYYVLTLDRDSIQVKIMGRDKKLKWDMTTDGKRIYFKDRIFKEDGSWKLLDITDSTMTFRESRYNGFEEEIIKLKRDSNGR